MEAGLTFFLHFCAFLACFQVGPVLDFVQSREKGEVREEIRAKMSRPVSRTASQTSLGSSPLCLGSA